MTEDKLIPPKEQEALRSWLKLLGTGNLVRKALQSKIQSVHGMSLSRFDVLANLYRAPAGGVRLSDLSRQLMVSNGNVTQVVGPLVREGLVERVPCPKDARAAIARLTRKGRALFETMATDHAVWVADIFADLSGQDHGQLIQLMDKLAPDRLTQD